MKKILGYVIAAVVPITLWVLLSPVVTSFFEEKNDETTVVKTTVLSRKDAVMYNDLGVQSARAGQYESAVQNLLKAIDIDPSDLLFHLNLARVYRDMGDTGSAADKYVYVARSDPQGEKGKAAAFELKSLAEFLKAEQEKQRLIDSDNAFTQGVNMIDDGLVSFKREELDAAKEKLQLAIFMLTSSLVLDPLNNQKRGYLLMAKGFLCHIIGKQFCQQIKADDSNYTSMTWLRVAYYPLVCSDMYYQYAGQFLVTPAQKDFLRNYIEANEFFINTTKKYLPQVDYDARSFLKSMNIEGQCIVNLDILNMMMNIGSYANIPSFIEENLELTEKLNTEESLNYVSIYNLYKAYEHFYNVTLRLKASPFLDEGNKAYIKNELDLMLGNINKARTNTQNISLVGLSDNLANMAQSMIQSIA